MTDKIITYCHLNDNYVHGNVVTSPHGISKCLTSAMGAGGGHTPLIVLCERVKR